MNFLHVLLIDKAILLINILVTLLLFASCAKEYFPKQFPPVKSCPGEPVVIYGSEEYPTVLIENRCWMAKNLNIGIMIHDSINMTDNGVIEKYCYEGDTTNCKIYGGLYVWDEAMQYKSEEGSRGICPEGWHIPTNREFVDLFIYAENSCEYLIANQDTLWKEFTSFENFNLTGFSAIPAGRITDKVSNSNYEPKKYYYGLQKYTVFWCSKEMNDYVPVYFRIPPIGSLVVPLEGHYYIKSDGLSIRCVKDE